MRSPKQIAIDITTNKDIKAKRELEKMIGKKFEEMTIQERWLGVICLSAFEKQWNN